MKEKPAYHHGNLRDSLMRSAFDLLDDGGPDNVGIRQIARLAGVAHSAPANHFRNRQALLTALATRVFEDIGSALSVATHQKSDNIKQSVQHFAGTVLDYGIQHPNRWRLIWRRDCLDNTDDALDAAMEAVYQRLIRILQSHPTRQTVDVESKAIAVWAMVHGYVSLRLDGILSPGQDTVTGHAREQAIIDLLVDGL